MTKYFKVFFHAALVTVFSVSFLTIPAPGAEAFLKGIHESATRDQLRFLKSDVLDRIVAGNLEQDAFFSTSGVWDEIKHFDNCAFQQSSRYIREGYDRAVRAANPDSFDNATLTREFGHILHSAQDFYAHSSWVEIGQGDLVDKKFTNWNLMRPLTNVEGTNVIIMQGEQRDIDAEGWRWVEGTPRYNYKIRTDAGEQSFIISGWFLLGGDHCPDKVAMPHAGWQAGVFFFWNPSVWSRGLHKDHAGRTGHTQARRLAERQTLHEFCRLVHLVFGTHGARGVRNLFEQWLPSLPTAAQFQNLCSGSSGITWVQPPPPPPVVDPGPTVINGITLDPDAQPLEEFGPLTVRELFFAVDELPAVLGGEGHCQLIKIQRGGPTTADLGWTPACRGMCENGTCPDVPRTVRAGRNANGEELFKWRCSCP
jgi:hypothetical protein